MRCVLHNAGGVAGFELGDGLHRGVDAELRLVSIPDDAPHNATGDMFDRDYMRAMEALGRQIGADPSRWSETIPSALTAD